MFHSKKCPIDGHECFLWLTKCKDCELYKKSAPEQERLKMNREFGYGIR